MDAFTHEHNKQNREVTILLEEYLTLRDNQKKLDLLLNTICDRPEAFDTFTLKGNNVGTVIKELWPDVYEDVVKED